MSVDLSITVSPKTSLADSKSRSNTYSSAPLVNSILLFVVPTITPSLSSLQISDLLTSVKYLLPNKAKIIPLKKLVLPEPLGPTITVRSESKLTSILLCWQKSSNISFFSLIEKLLIDCRNLFPYSSLIFQIRAQ